MATNTNGITTFWDFAFWYIDNNLGHAGNETQIAYVLTAIFLILGKEFPEDVNVDDMKLLGQECPTKDEIETWTESLTTVHVYINNASSYASNQLIKYSDLRYEKTVEDSITVTPSSISFSASPMYVNGAQNLTITASGSWTITRVNGVGSIYNRNGGSIITGGSAGTTKCFFSPGTNTTILNRFGSFRFTCGSATATFSWTQSAASTTTLSISPTSLTLSALGVAATNNVTVTCSGSWTASTTTSWINLSKTSGTGNGTLTVSADKNTGASSRSGTVTFKSGTQTRTLNVTQQGATTAKHYLTVSYNGSPDGDITTVAYIDGMMRPSVAYIEQNPIQICEITAADEGKSYSVRVSSTNPGDTCIPSQFTGTLPAIISSDYNVGTFLIQHGIS